MPSNPNWRRNGTSNIPTDFAACLEQTSVGTVIELLAFRLHLNTIRCGYEGELLWRATL